MIHLTRIFHSCDFHGSELVWKNAIRMGTYHKTDVIMVCGDLTGKAFVPIVKREADEWYCEPPRQAKQILHSEEDVNRLMENLQKRGLYSFETTPREIDELRADKKRAMQLFVRLMKETMRRWLAMISQVTPLSVKVIVNPGNDDCFELDEVIAQDDRVIYPLRKVVDIDSRYELISNEWANPTPWNTFRECTEKELAEKLGKEIERVDNCENLICNFHAPPYDTNLDLAPKLDKQFRVVSRFGSPIMEHVGSKAVRSLIEKYKPLLGLHGHIHESGGFQRLGRTLCLNPGSEYEQGILRGYIIDLPKSDAEKVRFWRI